jgi:Family of unknown function (DUF5670)
VLPRLFLQLILRFGLLPSSPEVLPLLKILMVVLVALWILGLLTKHMLGGFIHTCLVLALVLWLISLVRGESR